MTKSPLFFPKLLYFATWIVGLALVVLFETGILPSAFFPDDAGIDYLLSAICVLTFLGGSYIAMRLMALRSVRACIAAAPETSRSALYARFANVRTGILAASILISMLAYYGTAAESTAQYALLILAIALVFCYPSESELRAITEQSAKKTDNGAEGEAAADDAQKLPKE